MKDNIMKTFEEVKKRAAPAGKGSRGVYGRIQDGN